MKAASVPVASLSHMQKAGKERQAVGSMKAASVPVASLSHMRKAGKERQAGEQ